MTRIVEMYLGEIDKALLEDRLFRQGLIGALEMAGLYEDRPTRYGRQIVFAYTRGYLAGKRETSSERR